MKLIGAPLSPFVRKVRIVAAEKNISYDYDPSISPLNMPEDYVNIHPLRRIPALIVEADNPRAVINDSSAICAYFDRLQPNPALMPADTLQYGRMLWLEEYSDTGFTEIIGRGMFRPIMFNVLSGKAPDVETAQKSLVTIRKDYISYLEAQFGEGPWFGGSQFTLADIAIGCNLINMMHVGYRLQAKDSVVLADFFDRFLLRDSVAGLLTGESKALSKMGFSAPQLA